MDRNVKDLNQDEKARLVRKILELGYQVEPNALDVLCSRRNYNETLTIVFKLIKDKKNSEPENKYITGDDISFLFPKKSALSTKEALVDDSKVLFDSSTSISVPSDSGTYTSYFRSRYEKLNMILKERLDWKDIIPLNAIERMSRKGRTRFKLSGFIYQKWIDERKSYVVLEDDTGFLRIRIPQSLSEKLKEFLLDEFVIIDVVLHENVYEATSINHLDLAPVQGHRAKRDVYMVVLSNLKIGSNNFNMNSWNNLVSWLRGDMGELDIVSQIKYLILNGDLIERKLYHEIRISDMYQMLGELLTKLPDGIKIFIIPGELDATRIALPQPSISRNFAKNIYNLKNVVMLGNPSFLSLDGVFVLLYHGQALDDVKEQLSMSGRMRITSLMGSLLRARHLAPTFGFNTPVAPDETDVLVIRDLPDIFICSHMGERDIDYYKGVMLLSCQSWSDENVSKEGKAAVVNLRTFDVMWRI